MSSTIAALIAHAGFWVLLVYGWFWDEIGPKVLTVFLALWVAGWLGLSQVQFGGSYFVSYVAVLDIVLVFMIFKGDVRLT